MSDSKFTLFSAIGVLEDAIIDKERSYISAGVIDGSSGEIEGLREGEAKASRMGKKDSEDSSETLSLLE